jgi:hypothetical protein
LFLTIFRSNIFIQQHADEQIADRQDGPHAQTKSLSQLKQSQNSDPKLIKEAVSKVRLQREQLNANSITIIIILNSGYQLQLDLDSLLGHSSSDFANMLFSCFQMQISRLLCVFVSLLTCFAEALVVLLNFERWTGSLFHLYFYL